MEWTKKKLIFKAEQQYEWMQTHASVPTLDTTGIHTWRVYFGTRNAQNISFISFIDIDADDPSKIKYINDKPVLSPGQLGTFDDCGVMPSWIVTHENKKYLYYTGWNVRNTIPYHNSIGLAVSDDGGVTFKRYSEGPIIERSLLEPYFCALACVLIDQGLWKMWYLSCVKWSRLKTTIEPSYHIKYAESRDGVHWERKGTVAIDFKNDREGGIARACVIKDASQYKMWFSCRNIEDYRTDKNNSYRIGYAESPDGIRWVRKDEEAGIDVSENGWDSQMIEYPFVFDHKGHRFMLYNGNGFGTSGFGYAMLKKE